MKRHVVLVAVCGCSFLTGTAHARSVFHVDKDAPGPTHDGANWERAFTDLQDAIAAAAGGSEIWVAEGTYTPDGGSGDRTATFKLKTGVALRGGYAGYGSLDPNERDVEAFPTILSGDLFGNDGPDFTNNVENSYHVVTAIDVDPTAELDGVLIKGGNANGSTYSDGMGGGAHITDARPNISDCVFSNNHASSYGGGVYADGGAPVFNDCAFEGNAADSGGGMKHTNGSPVLRWCSFYGNHAETGGAVHSFGHYMNVVHLVFANCSFVDNTSESDGSAVYVSIDSGHSAKFINCVFRGNHSVPGNRAALFSDSGSVTVTVTNSIFWDNGGTTQEHQIGRSIPTLKYCTIQGWTGSWGGIWNNGADPLFADPDGRLSPGSSCIDSGDNDAFTAYLPSWLDLDSNPRFVDDVFTDDTGNGTPPIIDRGAYEFQGVDCDSPAVDCNDNNPCTIDSCDSVVGCIHDRIDCGPDYHCFDGVCVPWCDLADSDEDGDIDLEDFAVWQNCFTGPGK